MGGALSRAIRSHASYHHLLTGPNLLHDRSSTSLTNKLPESTLKLIPRLARRIDDRKNCGLTLCMREEVQNDVYKKESGSDAGLTGVSFTS
jgi:hypothetical protein